MKQITLPFLHAFTASDAPGEVAGRLYELEKHVLSFAPWPGYPYKPQVQFSIAYGSDALGLLFEVQEKSIRAAHGHTNEPVYTDSCVEFFVSFDEGTTYYNFEFNCIGTVLAGFGKERSGRQLLSQALLDKIKSEARIYRGGNSIRWEITLVLPFDVFPHHSLSSLPGRQCRANFYKCGDELPQPHFLSWSNIESSEPDFHLPAYFGTLKFA
ncbi:MAG: hypothetical protein INR73_18960 [Williamsia sp.]|nr:hypothetical protein [Williamsia sp.]